MSVPASALADEDWRAVIDATEKTLLMHLNEVVKNFTSLIAAKRSVPRAAFRVMAHASAVGLLPINIGTSLGLLQSVLGIGDETEVDSCGAKMVWQSWPRDCGRKRIRFGHLAIAGARHDLGAPLRGSRVPCVPGVLA